ncbi:VOC family protein [Maricaulis salignorans]|uniref:Catechol 2,3-dioxygenase n=1 Tax=Maricaulis salignorans TaxID=144026 RepID=A0A1G9LHD6_9PROT|nr:VOC family protein [Maricaulis salignorans]SDL61257.1 Catechol 2,3-dioxygenase [Maricaulis salignorans]
MALGAFSISLAVKDIRASKAFYEALGFAETGGNIDQGWVVLRLDDKVIGLFQGMFDKNMLTFNPGWGQHREELSDFEDVRALQARLKAAGLDVGEDIEPGTGPAHFMLTDPDGNPILIDQHV